MPRVRTIRTQQEQIELIDNYLKLVCTSRRGLDEAEIEDRLVAAGNDLQLVRDRISALKTSGRLEEVQT